MVQSPLSPAMRCTKFDEQLGAVAACAPPRDGTWSCRCGASRRSIDGKRRVLAHGLDRESVGQPRHAVAVAHPHRIALADLPDAVEERALVLDLHIRAPELGRMAALDRAAELDRRRLLAVADGRGSAGRSRRPPAARAASPPPSRSPGRPTGSPPWAASALQRLVGPVERHDLASRRPPRARAARSAASPGCRNR